MKHIVKNFIVEDEGAEIAEYALLIVILALGILAAVPTFTQNLGTAFSKTGGKASSTATTSLFNYRADLGGRVA
jgi:Flp pilus assembly pilin Flp